MTTYQSHPRATRPNALAGKRRRPSPSHCHTHASTPQHNKNTQKHAKTHAPCPPLHSTTETSTTGNERKQLSKSDDRKTPRKRPQISRIKPKPPVPPPNKQGWDRVGALKLVDLKPKGEQKTRNRECRVFVIMRFDGPAALSRRSQ